MSCYDAWWFGLFTWISHITYMAECKVDAKYSVRAIDIEYSNDSFQELFSPDELQIVLLMCLFGFVNVLVWFG